MFIAAHSALPFSRSSSSGPGIISPLITAPAAPSALLSVRASTSSIQLAGFMSGGHLCAPGAPSRYDTIDDAARPSGPTYAIQPPRCSSSRSSNRKNTSADGWWIVLITARCAFAMRRTTRITTTAARASRPLRARERGVGSAAAASQPGSRGSGEARTSWAHPGR